MVRDSLIHDEEQQDDEINVVVSDLEDFEPESSESNRWRRGVEECKEEENETSSKTDPKSSNQEK